MIYFLIIYKNKMNLTPNLIYSQSEETPHSKSCKKEEIKQKYAFTPSPKRLLKKSNPSLDADYNSLSTTPTSKHSTTSFHILKTVKTKISDSNLRDKHLTLKNKLSNFTNNFDEIVKDLQLHSSSKIKTKCTTSFVITGNTNLFKKAFNEYAELGYKKNNSKINNSPNKRKISFTNEKATKIGPIEVLNLKKERKISDTNIIGHLTVNCSGNNPLLSHLISNYEKKNSEKIQNEIKSLSNIEEIKDFYEYTEECLIKITKITPPKRSEIEDLQNQIKFSDELRTKKIAIFDLDETLVHCDRKSFTNCDVVLTVNLPAGGTAKVNSILIQIGVNIRPFLYECLDAVKKNYEIIVYTASHQAYADTILDYIDPKKTYFTHRLYRNNCLLVQADDEQIYVKDLRIFKDFNLKNIVIIDNSVLSFSFHLENGIPILPFYDNKQDNELQVLVNYLNHLYKEDDIPRENRKYIKLDGIMHPQEVSHFVEEIKEEDESIRLKLFSEETNFYSSGNNKNSSKKQKAIPKLRIEDFSSNSNNTNSHVSYTMSDLSKVSEDKSDTKLETGKKYFEECQKNYRSLFKK